MTTLRTYFPAGCGGGKAVTTLLPTGRFALSPVDAEATSPRARFVPRAPGTGAAAGVTVVLQGSWRCVSSAPPELALAPMVWGVGMLTVRLSRAWARWSLMPQLSQVP